MNSKKDSAVSFLNLVSKNQIDQAFEKFVDPRMRHHNPYFKDDAESLKQGMKENARDFPEKEYKIEHVFEDGDFVIVHGLVTLTTDKQFMAVHILKFKNDKQSFSSNKIIEMWDIGQELPT